MPIGFGFHISSFFDSIDCREDAQQAVIRPTNTSIRLARDSRCRIELAHDINITPRQTIKSPADQVYASISSIPQKPANGEATSMPPKIYSTTQTTTLSLNITTSRIKLSSRTTLTELQSHKTLRPFLLPPPGPGPTPQQQPATPSLNPPIVQLHLCLLLLPSLLSCLTL